MIRFEDGPAKGKTLECNRYPVFLRAVHEKKAGLSGVRKWDACDQDGDSPRHCETPVCYVRVGKPSTVHIDGFKDGKRFGRWMELATYRLYKRGPDERTMRDNTAWQAWCSAEYARAKAAAPDAKAPGVQRAVEHKDAEAP